MTRPDGSALSALEYSGNFPCTADCTGCGDCLLYGKQYTGFPFELTEELGRGGFARVVRGKFHQKDAAFKFVPVTSQGYTYDTNAVGCHEYNQQDFFK